MPSAPVGTLMMPCDTVVSVTVTGPSGIETDLPIKEAAPNIRSLLMLLTKLSILVFMATLASSCENCANWATNASFLTGSVGSWFFNWVVNKVKNSV